MILRRLLALLLFAIGISTMPEVATALPVATTAREIAESIFEKFGRGAAEQTVEQVSEKVARALALHGDDVKPFLRNSGHDGLKALEAAGNKAPEVIKLYRRKGNEAIWIISEPRRLTIFLKHGDSAADALIKHPGLAENLIDRYGSNAAGALTSVSRQNAQRLVRVADDGLLDASKRSSELLPMIRKYGDPAMDFVWKNKGALAVLSVLGTFLADPQAYLTGAKELITPISSVTNWTLLLGGLLVVAFLPFIARSIMRTRKAIKAEQAK